MHNVTVGNAYVITDNYNKIIIKHVKIITRALSVPTIMASKLQR